jgi:predicted dehydrogenase/threonine dehydrogenase-like Zn-dependent dehydrogenase
MKAVIQNYKEGDPTVVDVARPALRPGGALVANAVSLISPGTERAMVETARKSLLGKARERPELAREVLAKAARDGIAGTISAVRNRLDSPVALGYSSAGVVIEVGDGVDDLRPGDRVACSGAGYASHAEEVFVPKNLLVRLPDEVDFESASFTTLGAIALQGLRLAKVELGEIVAVVGLGLVGLLTVELAKAAGCLVVGLDPDPDRAKLAVTLGADDAVTNESAIEAAVARLSGSHGADAVVLTASTKSNEPVSLAGRIARDRGTVVAVGAVGTSIPRNLFYEKELAFHVSRSYGAGRYDKSYEEEGHDYPIGYVRWTENRNMRAFVRQLASGGVRVEPLISHRFPIEDAAKAYELITGEVKVPSLGIVLEYPKVGSAHLPAVSDEEPSNTRAGNAVRSDLDSMSIGMLGAGQFATSVLLPAIKKSNSSRLVGVCAATGPSAEHARSKFAFDWSTTDEARLLQHPDINAIVVATPHDLHARQVVEAIHNGKDVFCEKPLAVSRDQLQEVVDEVENITLAKSGSRPVLTVGYNRRFAPLSVVLKDFMTAVTEPMVVNYRVNAGYIPRDHWVQDAKQGGRIIGELCHFVDFLVFLTGAVPQRVVARALPNAGRYSNDNLVTTLEFSDGSLGTIIYVANGSGRFPKERVEVFGGGLTGVIDNFRSAELISGSKRRRIRSRGGQDKGHAEEWAAFVEGTKSRELPIPFGEIVSVSEACFAIVDSLQGGSPVEPARLHHD